MSAATPADAPLHERDATHDDLDAIEALDAAVFGNPWSAELYRQELFRAYARLRVLVEGEAIVGLCCSWQIGDEAHLLRIATRADRRGRGLGRRLLRSCLAHARERGCASMVLEVAASNEVAIGLYRAHGFTEIGRRRGYYRHPPDDGVTMRCALAAPPEGADAEPSVRSVVRP